MNTHARRLLAVKADARALALIALFVAVIGASLAVRLTYFDASAVTSVATDASTGQQAAAGIAWAVIEAVFAAVLLAGIAVWKLAPDWVQGTFKDAMGIALWMFVGAYAFWREAFFVAVAGIVGVFVIAKLTDRVNLWWVVNDMLALALAVYLAVFVGVILSPIIIAAGLVGLTAYDYWFADRRTHMVELAGWTVRRKLPLLFVIPQTARLEWDALADRAEAADDLRPLLFFGIGMADLLLPAAFAVALAHSNALVPLAGAVAGVLVACFRVSWKMTNGGGAGLPPLTAGALGGWAVGMAVVV